MQKWTAKARYVKGHTLSRANACKNRHKLNPVVISQLPTSTAAAGKVGGPWELVAALLWISTSSTSTNQSSDRPVLIWATAAGPTPEEKWHNALLASSSWTLLPPICRTSQHLTPQSPCHVCPALGLFRRPLHRRRPHLVPAHKHHRCRVTSFHMHLRASEHGFTEQQAQFLHCS